MNTTTPQMPTEPSHDHIRMGKTANTESDTKTPTVMIGELSRRLRLEKPQVMSTGETYSMCSWQPGRGGATATVASAVMCWTPCRMRCDCTDNNERTSNTQVRQQAVTKGRRIHAHVITPACSTNQATIPNNPSRNKGPNLRPPWIVMGDKPRYEAWTPTTQNVSTGTSRNPAKNSQTRGGESCTATYLATSSHEWTETGSHDGSRAKWDT